MPSWVATWRQLSDDVIEGNGVEAEMLAARSDGLRNILRLRGRHHEDDVLRWFLQDLQQRIEGCIGDLVGFVEQVDLVAIAGRGVARRLAQFANLVDPAVGGGIDFDYVQGVAGANLGAGVADPAGFGARPLRAADLVAAIEGHGQDPGDGRLAYAAMPTEDVAVGHPLLLQSVAQCTGHMILSSDIGEALGTIFAGENLVSHREDFRLPAAQAGRPANRLQL